MIKIGDYIVALDEISYIKIVSSCGCVVTLKTGGILSICDVPECDINNLFAICFKK